MNEIQQTKVLITYDKKSCNTDLITTGRYRAEHSLVMQHLREFDGFIPLQELMQLLGCNECPAFQGRIYKQSVPKTMTIISPPNIRLSDTRINCWLSTRKDLNGVVVPCQRKFANLDSWTIDLPLLDRRKLEFITR
jgi:hypothetical protein